MGRSFKRVDYAESGKQSVTIDDCLPADHLARFVVTIISMLDLSAIYAHYAPVGGEAFAPELLLGLLRTATGRQVQFAQDRGSDLRLARLLHRRGWHPITTRLPTFARRFWCTSWTCLRSRDRPELGIQLGNISRMGASPTRMPPRAKW
jgi:hypothetical protein